MHRLLVVETLSSRAANNLNAEVFVQKTDSELTIANMRDSVVVFRLNTLLRQKPITHQSASAIVIVPASTCRKISS